MYNPFNYGLDSYLKYLEIYFRKKYPKYAIIGLNPGIDDAVQTCIPFTDAYNSMKYLGIDYSEYITEHKNVEPRKYENEPKKPSAKLFYEAINEFSHKELFFNKVIPLDVFPLSISEVSERKNKGGFYAKNITPNKVNLKIRHQLRELTDKI